MVLYELNWSFEVYNFFIAGVIMIASTIIILREYLKVKKKFHLYFVIIWILFSIYMFLGGFGILFLSKELYKWRIPLLFISTFLLIYNFDIMYRGSLDPIKFFIFGIIITGVIYSSFNPDSIVTTTVLEHPSFQTSGLYGIWLSIFALQIALLFVFYSSVIYINAPKLLKKKALVALIGAIFVGLFFIISFRLRLTKVFPGFLYIIIAIGGFILGLSFKLEPKLLKMLTTSASRAKIKYIYRILPICAHCKKIRDTEGKWQQLEHYLLDYEKLKFSHGLCPECLKKHYTEYLDD